jgi:hypothetical protein
MSEPTQIQDWPARGMSLATIALIVVQSIISLLGKLPEPKPEPTPEPIPVPVVVVDWYEETADGDRIENPKASDFAGSCTEGVRYFRGYPVSGKIKLLKVTVEDMVSPAPVPPLPPKPPVPPKPIPPKPDLTGLALETFEQVKAMPKDQCKKLASNYESVASAIAAGGILTLADAEKKLFELNRGLSLGREWSGFAQWSGSKLDALKELKAVGLALDEIATGLRTAGESQ